ncbi:ferritin [Clostridium polynesiense]|uniref:ferritin n=1 Tax=Clostridium polynesiense TaxID=1325933 RepID=UPI00058AD1D3|nr:ferritin [Clostridium polynesiense]
MLSKRIEELLNEQINYELFSSYLYLSMSAYLSDLNMNGYAHWFHIQAQEEKDHAMIIYNYVISAGGRVRLEAIDGPKTEFTDIREVLEETLEHERMITQKIYKIVDEATSEKDYKTVKALEWFINEQVEEEENAVDNIAKYNMLADDAKGLYLLDKEMLARVYVPSAMLGNKA